MQVYTKQKLHLITVVLNFTLIKEFIMGPMEVQTEGDQFQFRDTDFRINLTVWFLVNRDNPWPYLVNVA